MSFLSNKLFDRKDFLDNVANNKPVEIYGIHSSYDTRFPNVFHRSNYPGWFGYGTYFSILDESGILAQMDGEYRSRGYSNLCTILLKNPCVIEGPLWSPLDVRDNIDKRFPEFQKSSYPCQESVYWNSFDENTYFDSIVYLSNRGGAHGPEHGSQVVLRRDYLKQISMIYQTSNDEMIELLRNV